MVTRRDFVQAAIATAVLTGSSTGLARAAARQSITQADLLRFEPMGQVTLLHFTDLHAQLRPVYFREPSVNIGVGTNAGLPPHLTGNAFLEAFGIPPDTANAYALSSADFAALAKEYGRMGGFDRMATLVKAIRAERPTQTLLLDGGDTWQGSYTSLKERGADMVAAQNLLGVEAMTGHWEFTYGQDRVKELKAQLKAPFLCGNVKDATWGERIFDGTKVFERGGVAVAVIGQAFPYTPIANPRWLMPDWSFGIEEDRVRAEVDAARKAGADVVVLLSHNGFDVDRKLAARVTGIDVILTGHTHDAIPRSVMVGKTILTAPGSHGKFLGRLDLYVKGKQVVDHRFRLIPIFTDAIVSDPAMAALIANIRAPYEAELDRVLARTDSLLYRRGNFNGTFDDLICQSLLAERNAQIALSPGFRWGTSLLPGQDIRIEDLYNQTAITYPAAYRSTMTGATLKSVFEDVADNLFNPDPYYQQGGDMVRVGGMSYAIDVAKPIGSRISEMRLTDGTAIEPAKTYVVAGWASVNQGTEGPAIYDVVTRYLERRQVVSVPDRQVVRVRGADPRGIAP
ncbi:thiosulfohydrolase SoxB [Vulcanimicrobium alpinum]|uniref:Thiosulfohydrolase SoxB n=1 Tax=Vulcanimicrobium alpinum TaxID=3016050 RepID=A0AAN2C9M4_UNVUL|nr:thiosulfohydrolase SoxB [Vulcanimicrobium alpinum]BDE06176.1 thiosulfohydrolase SoxB [Vulcanimicrobium alpinum]